MSVQLALRFDAVPVTCEVQQRITPLPRVWPESALRRNRRKRSISVIDSHLLAPGVPGQGMPGLFPATQYPREPYTPERIIVQLIFFKCCAPKAGDRELARVIHHLTGHQIHNHTVKTLCERFFFWRHPEFQQLLRYPVPTEPQALRMEVVRLSQQGWTETRTAELLRASGKTFRKWLRARQQAQQSDGSQPLLIDLPRAPHHPRRKVYFGAIHAVLTLQKKYGYAR